MEPSKLEPTSIRGEEAGENRLSQLGDGSSQSQSGWVRVASTSRFQALAAGFGHTCGLLTDGSALCWGYNASGQLGSGTTTTAAVPVRVQATTTFSAIAAASNTSCAVAVDGSAWCWGANDSGQFGAGDLTSSAIPRRASAVVSTPPVSFSRIALGGGEYGSPVKPVFACATAADSRLFCWGDNSSGQLGDGTLTNRLVPPTPVRAK